MALITSSHFAASAATGADWRECAKAVIEQLQAAQADDSYFNFGFLYYTDALAEDGGSILNIFKSALGIENWIGSVTLGVCANGDAYIDQPAISAMIGRFEDHAFQMFNGGELSPEGQAWREAHDPMLVFTHGDPLIETELSHALGGVNEALGGFMVGGLSSSRHTHHQIADGKMQQGGFSGALFSDSVNVATTLTQGCRPIGGIHEITMGDAIVMKQLDGEKAVQIFENDLRKFAMQKIGRDPDEVILDKVVVDDPSQIPDEYKTAIKGEMHIAFPVPHSDQNDYLVRNIMGLDPDDGSIMVSQYISKGDRIMFVHRDDESVRSDLRTRVQALKDRVQADHGVFAPKGAVYVSCVARALSNFKEDGESEMAIIQDILGDVPITGFYAGGEISNARLYGYTGILTLFL